MLLITVYMLSGLFWYLVGCYLSAIYHNHVLLTLALYYCTIVSLLISSILVLNGEIIMLDLLFLTAPMLKYHGLCYPANAIKIST